MSKYLLILNEAAYGSERSYNALRLAVSLATHTAITRPAEFEVRIFLLGDAVTCAKRGQKVPQRQWPGIHQNTRRTQKNRYWINCLKYCRELSGSTLFA